MIGYVVLVIIVFGLFILQSVQLGPERVPGPRVEDAQADLSDTVAYRKAYAEIDVPRSMQACEEYALAI